MLIQSAGFGEGQLLGDGLGIAAGIFYAGFILTASRLRSRFSSAVVNTWTCLIGAPLLLVAALTAGQEVIPASTGGWAVVIALGVISQAGGQGSSFGVWLTWQRVFPPSSFWWRRWRRPCSPGCFCPSPWHRFNCWAWGSCWPASPWRTGPGRRNEEALKSDTAFRAAPYLEG